MADSNAKFASDKQLMDIFFQEKNKLSEKAVCVVHYMSCGLEIFECMKDLNLTMFIRQMP